LMACTEEFEACDHAPVEPWYRSSTIGSGGDDNGARRVLPNALDPSKTRSAQCDQMPVYAIDKPIAVQEKTTRREKTIDRGIAREDFFAVSKIVEDYRRDRQIEWPSDLLRPSRIHQVGKDV